MQQKMVGRFETGETLELVWEHPELGSTCIWLKNMNYASPAARPTARLEVVSRTVETLLGLVQKRSSMREWYIVVLIIAELVLAAYSMPLPWL